MFSLLNVQTRYYEFTQPNGKVLHLEPPKLKALNKITKMGEATEPDELAAVIAPLISKNKEQRKIDADTIMEWMDADQCAEFLADFLGWVNHEKQADPN